MKPSRARRQRRIIEATLTLLAGKYPAVFVLLESKRKPLKLGIRDDVIAALPELKPNHVGTALHAYTGTPGYLMRVVEGAERIGLDGQAVGVVTAGEAAHAVKLLEFARAQRVPKMPESTTMTKSVIAPAEPPPKRLGLADLRRAAQARKAG